MKLRKPIVTVAGHVDHGKTSILDAIRESCVQKGESGGITQKISFSSCSLDQLKKISSLINSKKIEHNISGFLFIDTPGHAAFTNLRKRGGSLSDLTILVIDINDGIKPQTAEVLKILKLNKTPFLIALNKIDNISGWIEGKRELKEDIESQREMVKDIFNQRYMAIIASLNSFGFDADLFYNIKDFTKQISMVPCSARTQEGLGDLMGVLYGLSQKYLRKKLILSKTLKGIILEIKKEKNLNYIEALIYDGDISEGEEIAISNFQGNPVITKIRTLEEMGSFSKFEQKKKIVASAGIRMNLTSKENLIPGMSFVAYENNLEEIKKSFKDSLSENIKLDKKGIIIKAESLGSLEALLILLRQEGIKILKAGIGDIEKSDIINAKVTKESNELDVVILGFNVGITEDAKKMKEGIKIIIGDVIYKIIDNLKFFREKKKAEIEKKKFLEMGGLFKVKILPQFIFKNSNPAIFGVRVEAGTLTQNTKVLDENGEEIGKIKKIQEDKSNLKEAKEGMEVAISISNINFERKLKNKKFLYSDMGFSQFKKLKKNKELLSSPELRTLVEIYEIKKGAWENL